MIYEDSNKMFMAEIAEVEKELAAMADPECPRVESLLELRQWMAARDLRESAGN